MRISCFSVFCLLVAGTISADEVSDSCLSCHRNALSLDSWTAEALDARLREIINSSGEHPVPLPELDDDQLRALAEALASG